MPRRLSRRAFLFGALALAATPPLVRFGNDSLTRTALDLPVLGLPSGFDGYRVVQLSDLHGKVFAPDQRPLLDMVAEARPDLVVLTGDLVDHWHGGVDMVAKLAEALLRLAPVAACGGNHEWESRLGPELWNRLLLRGVMVLRNESFSLERGGERLVLAGLEDYPGYENREHVCRAQLNLALQGVSPGACVLLLAHRPQHFSLYARAGVNLALCGHIHGGQFRLPGLGGLLSPDRTFFPQHDAGAYNDGGATMFVHRGLGNSGIPVRINNRPEVAVLTLRAAS